MKFLALPTVATFQIIGVGSCSGCLLMLRSSSRKLYIGNSYVGLSFCVTGPIQPSRFATVKMPISIHTRPNISLQCMIYK